MPATTGGRALGFAAGFDFSLRCRSRTAFLWACFFTESSCIKTTKNNASNLGASHFGVSQAGWWHLLLGSPTGWPSFPLISSNIKTK